MSKQHDDEARRIANASGNSFHAKVLRYLQEQGWAVLISPYYSDSATGKPREIDLIAEKSFPVVRDTWGKVKGNLNVQLYVECKYVKQTTVFWTHVQDRNATLNLLERTTPLRSNNIYTNRHHYLLPEGERVAKLFSGPKVSALESEQIFRALNQSLSALITLRSSGTAVLPQKYTQVAKVSYPIIVCSDFDRFYSIEIGSDDDPVRVSESFLLEVNYAYTNSAGRNISEYFLLDIVSWHNLPGFLRQVETDVEAMAVLLSD